MPEAFFESLARHARDRPSAPAVCLVHDEERSDTVEYQSLWEAVSTAAGRARRQYAPDRPIPICLPNGLEFIVEFLGALLSGRQAMPLSPLDPQLPGCPPAPDLRGAVEIGENSGVILRSSGTTGLPKLVRRDGASLDAVARNVAQATGFTKQDRVLVTIPLCHSYGIENGLLAPLLAGATVHLCEHFDLRLVLRQWRHGVTVMPGVPFMFEVLAGLGEQGSATNLRLAYSAGATLPASVFDAFSNRHGLSPGQLYGATEIGSVTFNDPVRPGFDPRSVGLAMEGVSIRILDIEGPSLSHVLPHDVEGQVAVRAPSMLRGYVGEAGDPLLDGYFLTGDLGRLDAHGALTITGRLKLLIDVGGMKVNPLEVESVLMEHPCVGECAVVPTPISQTLVRLKAYVVPRAADAIDPQELRRFARQHLAQYKVPRTFEICSQLPRSPLGKLQRHLLTESIAR